MLRPAIVAFDVQRPKSRRRIHKVLKAWKLGGQRTVIECRLTTPQAEELMLQLGQLINPETDRLLLAWMDTRRTARARGTGTIDCLQAFQMAA